MIIETGAFEALIYIALGVASLAPIVLLVMLAIDLAKGELW